MQERLKRFLIGHLLLRACSLDSDAPIAASERGAALANARVGAFRILMSNSSNLPNSVIVVVNVCRRRHRHRTVTERLGSCSSPLRPSSQANANGFSYKQGYL